MMVSERWREGMDGKAYGVIASIICELESSLDALLEIVCRDDACTLALSPFAELFVAQLCLAPRVVVSVQRDAKMRHGQKPIIDFTAVHGVLTVGEARGASTIGTVFLAKIGASWAAKSGDLVLPAQGKDAFDASCWESGG
jgi:hypothetical protein